MTFGSRRMTIRNRKHLRKFTPVNTPANMPLGLPRNNLPPSTSVQKTQQPPTQLKDYDLPSPPPTQLWEQPQVHIQTGPVTAQPQDVQTQSPPQQWQVQQQHQEPVQAHPLSQPRHVPDYIHEDSRLDIPGTQENNVIPDPYQLSMHTHNDNPAPVAPGPGPDHPPPLRRSERATRGQTSRYEDFVQTIFPVCPSYQYQCPQVMTNQYEYPQMMSNQMMTNQMMTNKVMTNNVMTNPMPMQPAMLSYH